MGNSSIQRAPADDYWRLAVLLGLGMLICASHFLGNLCEELLGQVPINRDLDDRIVWATGLPDGEGLYRLDWLTKVVGTPKQSMPALATIHFTAEQPFIVAGIHPQAALLFFQPIPLNLADAEVLAALPGIGPALTARMIAKREELGGFQSLGQLRQVRGIGVKTLANLHDRLTL